jgi:hypothetical protein
MHDDTQTISLTQAAKLAPGRPSANCMWRWARRGVLARSGQRIKLEHLRVGGKIFTTPAWVREFGQRLAAADATYFDRQNAAPPAPVSPPRPPIRGLSVRQVVGTAGSDLLRELEEAGL